MRCYSCYFFHLQNKKLITKCGTACWAGLKNLNKNTLDNLTKDNIYIDKYIEPEITDIQRKRIVYLINKITPCKFIKIKGKIYIQYKLLKNHYSNLLLLNFIRILWYKNKAFNNKEFFIDICKRKPRNLDYLEFMMTCIKNNVNNYNNNSWDYGDHSFVYLNILPKKKEKLLEYTGNSMREFLQLN